MVLPRLAVHSVDFIDERRSTLREKGRIVSWIYVLFWYDEQLLVLLRRRDEVRVATRLDIVVIVHDFLKLLLHLVSFDYEIGLKQSGTLIIDFLLSNYLVLGAHWLSRAWLIVLGIISFREILGGVFH